MLHNSLGRMESSLASPLKVTFTSSLPIYQFKDNTVSSRTFTNLDYNYIYAPTSLLLQHGKEFTLSVKKWKEKHTLMEEIVIVTKTRQSIMQRIPANDFQWRACFCSSQEKILFSWQTIRRKVLYRRSRRDWVFTHVFLLCTQDVLSSFYITYRLTGSVCL